MLPYLKPKISSKVWQIPYSQSSAFFLSFTLHLGWRAVLASAFVF